MAARAERSGPSGPRLDAMTRARVIAELKDPHLLPMQLREDGSGYEPAPFGGRTLSELRTGATGPPSLSFGLRILLDVLRGLAAVHGAKLNGTALGFVHGEVVPSHIVVGIDGKARLIPLVPAHWTNNSTSLPPEVVGYTAPERLLGDKFDQRADVFSAGVLLWEAIMGEPLFRDRTPDAIVTRLIGGKVPYPVPSSDAPWAVALSEVALGALSVEPKARCAHVGALGAQIEKIARGKLASAQELASLVAASMGHGQRDSSVESMPTVRQASPLSSGSMHLHSPSSVPAQPGADTLGGANRPSSSSSSVARTRRAEPAPERPPSASSGKVASAASLAVTTAATVIPPAGATSAAPAGAASSSSMRTAPAAAPASSSSMPAAPATAPSSSSMLASAPSSSSMPKSAPSSALPGPTLVSVVSPLPPPAKSSRAPSSPEIEVRSEDSTSVAPVEPARRTAPPPMTARRQWRIVGTAIAVSFAVAGFAAYALLDWNPVSTANETVLVPPPLSTISAASSASPVAAANPAAGAPAASSSAAPPAASARSTTTAAPTLPRPVAQVPAYRPPVAAPVRPLPASPHPAPPAARPPSKPAEGPGKQSETERFGI
jgi:serine/threonine protein kinase